MKTSFLFFSDEPVGQILRPNPEVKKFTTSK